MKLPQIHLENVVLSFLLVFFAVMIFSYSFGEFSDNVLNRIPERSLSVEGMGCQKQEGMGCQKQEGMGCKKQEGMVCQKKSQ